MIVIQMQDDYQVVPMHFFFCNHLRVDFANAHNSSMSDKVKEGSPTLPQSIVGSTSWLQRVPDACIVDSFPQRAEVGMGYVCERWTISPWPSAAAAAATDGRRR
jgi:hypothetical protein